MLSCVQANFSGKRHELNVSTYQMCILLLFNEADRLSYGDIREATQITPAELKRNLQSLACVKVQPIMGPGKPKHDDLHCPMRQNKIHILQTLQNVSSKWGRAATACRHSCRCSCGLVCHVTAGGCMRHECI